MASTSETVASATAATHDDQPVVRPMINAAIEIDTGADGAVDVDVDVDVDVGVGVADMSSRRERNKADKRRRILAAGRFLFRTQGFEATTAAAIAAQAGIGAGTFYLYATSKEDLLVAVFKEEVSQVWDDAFALVDPSSPVEEQVQNVFDHVMVFHERDPELSRAFFKELMFVSPPLRATVDGFMSSIYDRFEALLDVTKAGGQLPDRVPTYDLARNLFSLWYPIMQTRHADAISLEVARTRLERALRLALWDPMPPDPLAS